MATKQEHAFKLKLLVDKERNSVVMAEASGEFIDTLFSFLTLPLGTIIRLVSENDHPKDIGCISNLYHSVQSSADEVFWNHICKKMLLRPRNSSESLCKKLKLNVDDTEPLRYFICGFCKKQSMCNSLLSTFAGASCSSCGKLMDEEIKFLLGDSSSEVHTLHHDGVFVKGDAMFLVCDDLKVFQNSPNKFVEELVQLGYKNFNKLTEIFISVGLKEILDLLRQALTSKSPLSDVFLGNGESKEMYNLSPKIVEGLEAKTSKTTRKTINLKVTVRKSKKQILYAEAEEDFVDFLFSFLTAPLGSILNLLDGNSSLGCIDTLYKSVKELNSSWFINPPATPLLNLQVAPQFGYKNQPIKLYEGHTPSYWYGKGVIKNNICYERGDGVISTSYGLQSPVLMTLFDPRSSGTSGLTLGFVNRPSLFVIWDDLKVTPLANTSTISLMQKMNVPLGDLEVHMVTINEKEALNLLGASLTSKAALTQGLSYLLRMPKEEPQA